MFSQNSGSVCSCVVLLYKISNFTAQLIGLIPVKEKINITVSLISDLISQCSSELLIGNNYTNNSLQHFLDSMTTLTLPCFHLRVSVLYPGNLLEE